MRSYFVEEAVGNSSETGEDDVDMIRQPRHTEDNDDQRDDVTSIIIIIIIVVVR